MLSLPLSAVSAQQLRYTPTNPHFGGSPFNGAELMASAGAQRAGAASGNSAAQPSSSVRDFASNLEARISSRLSQYVSDQIFSTSGSASASGTFTLGNLSVAYQRIGSTEVRLNIRDVVTGEATTVTYPLNLFVP